MMAAARVFVAVLVLLMLGGRTGSVHDGPLLLLVSFDGFRYDYLDRSEDRVQLPSLKYLIETGVRARWLHNTFVTVTWPNHFSLVTGLHAESHGMVANHMYDPDLDEQFHMYHNNEPRWYAEAEPIWITNQRYGGKSGVLNWPGMEVRFNGSLPFRSLPEYNESMPYEHRIETMIQWFTDEENPINLGVLYFEEPDEVGHEYGPDSPELDRALEMLDRTVEYLIELLQSAGLFERMNVIITSDHGMAETSRDRVIELDRYLDPSTYLWVDTTPVTAIWPLEHGVDREYIFAALDDAHPNLQVYYKEDIPAQYHYRHNRRIMPVIAVADPGWTIVQNISTAVVIKGQHGYNNSYLPMNPIFVAHGPAFRTNLLSEPFNNVDIYPLMCHILGIRPLPNNGSIDSTVSIVKRRKGWWSPSPRSMSGIAGTLSLLLMLVGCIAGCGYYSRKREHAPGRHLQYSIIGYEMEDYSLGEPLVDSKRDV
ncbi:ectonucleotide pyrophosphatase/phosphodiesterase family member 5-like [Branchiostoma lanceolatum]|uniref:ectonucleotide pyrophosphatase/phosphodiesterase family member 5-like n=1 Tax=Branchiostoma lanceolatum TaxID=7740 RepID=UPI0034540FAE